MRSSVIAIPAFEASFAVLASIATLGCSIASLGSRSEKRPIVLFEERFDQPEAVQRAWLAVSPEVPGAATFIEDGGVHFVLPSGGQLELMRPIDVSAVRDKRVRVSARVRTDATTADAYVAVGFGSAASPFRTHARTRPVPAGTWTSVSVLADVDTSTDRAELALVVQGQGTAWFDDVTVEMLGATAPSAVVLSPLQLQNAIALTRAAALIRHRHPSDQAASLDWDAFLPVAMDRILRVRDEAALLKELQDLFANIAPTVQFSRLNARSHREPPRNGTVHLSRWRYAGLGPTPPYTSWREGREPDQARIRVETPVELPQLSRCRKAQLRATVRDVGGDGQLILYADVDLPGYSSRRFDRKVTRADSSFTFDFDMPAEAYRVRLGTEVKGRGEIALEALSLSCDNRDSVQVNVAEAAWEHRGFVELYQRGLHSCDARRCLQVARRPLDTAFVAARDVLDAQIADDLWIHVPVAVWANERHTLPTTGTWSPPAAGTVSDTAERLSTLASAWGTLSIFYPYFEDQNIDWARELPTALVSAAAARSTSDTYKALSRLIAKLRDNHARAIHPDFPIDGLLPVALRKFDDKLVVVGALSTYQKLVPVGAEVLSIDRVPALQAYAVMSERVSSATSGWQAWAVPTWLTLGPTGVFSIVRIKTAGSREVDVLLPHLSREHHDSLVKEPRPAFGAELAPGVHYVDLEALKAERWQALLPALSHARAVILDMRGYPSNAVFSLLGHFVDKELRSPEWQLPTLESGGYVTAYWTIHPMRPRLAARLVVLLDGRSASAAETFLQIVQENRLAVLVGETSSGTNGNARAVALPGGFSMRFTGMRVPRADGTAVQGRGIVPDEVVHPTLEGVRAGRDEVLEASIELVVKLVAK